MKRYLIFHLIYKNSSSVSEVNYQALIDELKSE